MKSIIQFAHSIDVPSERVCRLIRLGKLNDAIRREGSDGSGLIIIDETKITHQHMQLLRYTAGVPIQTFCNTCDCMCNSTLYVPTDPGDEYVNIAHHIHVEDQKVPVSISIKLTEDFMNEINTRWSDLHID